MGPIRDSTNNYSVCTRSTNTVIALIKLAESLCGYNRYDKPYFLLTNCRSSNTAFQTYSFGYFNHKRVNVELFN